MNATKEKKVLGYLPNDVPHRDWRCKPKNDFQSLFPRWCGKTTHEKLNIELVGIAKRSNCETKNHDTPRID